MRGEAVEDPPRHGEGDRAKRGGGGLPRAIRPETALARRQRRALALPEVLLWEHLRAARTGAKFRRQHPIGPYVTDFCCVAHRLIVEVDGEAHNRGTRTRSDAIRDSFLCENGYRILRYPAAEVLRDPAAVAASIAALLARPLHQPAAGPPPRPGEDLAQGA
ncbi:MULTISPECIES: endonuclease domain-containing protein [unclassified Sphingosinithalassobacter]|uniref:endonuclease domain-containing protein n=1 Tax=unclassified Sphingosinithalassobacter TaxID=2676235 RepID=UPI00292D0D1E|nr:DUF559 domain-containing protein [Sphingosinithalassobacter sp. CS137]